MLGLCGRESPSHWHSGPITVPASGSNFHPSVSRSNQIPVDRDLREGLGGPPGLYPWRPQGGEMHSCLEALGTCPSATPTPAGLSSSATKVPTFPLPLGRRLITEGRMGVSGKEAAAAARLEVPRGGGWSLEAGYLYLLSTQLPGGWPVLRSVGSPPACV